MAPFDDPIVFWEGTLCLWECSASDILNEQGLEESVQGSTRGLSMPSAENTAVWGWDLNPDGDFWAATASDILSEEAQEIVAWGGGPDDIYSTTASDILSEEA